MQYWSQEMDNVDNKLAIEGGKPVREKKIPYGRQWINEEDIEAVIAVLKSDYLTTGPVIKEFEDKVAKFAGARYAVAFSNGTTALHGAAFAAGIGPEDEVITTPLTFVASANCALYMGATPIFADVNPHTYNLDPADVRRKITDKTKAIVMVDFTGQPADYYEIKKIADEFGLKIIEDAAHALGATYHGQRVGSYADLTEFSFHPVKHITTGEGGIVVTNDEVLYQKLILFRTHGITRNPELMENNEGPWYYEQLELGNNYRITDIQCALGLSQMNRLPQFLTRRREIAALYNVALSNVRGILLPQQVEYVNSAWHLYIIQLQLEEFTVGRREIFDALIAENVGVNVHYIPVYYHPYYQRLGYEKGICPIVENLYDRFITIPLFPEMTDDDVDSVVKAVKKVMLHYYK